MSEAELLKIGRFIADAVVDGGIILVRNPDSTVDRVIFPNLETGDDRRVYVERWRMAGHMAREDIPR